MSDETPKLHIDSDWKAEAQAEKESGLQVSMWCHQPGGRNSTSPSAKVASSAAGTASAAKRGKRAWLGLG